MKRTVIISSLTLAVVAFLWACAGESPKQVGEKFLNAMAVGDFEAAKKWASKESHTSLDMMASQDRKFDPKKIEVGDEMVSENKARHDGRSLRS